MFQVRLLNDKLILEHMFSDGTILLRVFFYLSVKWWPCERLKLSDTEACASPRGALGDHPLCCGRCPQMKILLDCCILQSLNHWSTEATEKYEQLKNCWTDTAAANQQTFYTKTI